ncbi:DUF732 domain-containing protein [Prescottella subtropica]|uniref:DUF732 domain-containing protein n=1 Tax=Prescottella subtropica TaxID=2545757 RepID=UPI0013868580|nr:DUF732 domain-containing protein [Prescottella subtropica]
MVRAGRGLVAVVVVAVVLVAAVVVGGIVYVADRGAEASPPTSVAPSSTVESDSQGSGADAVFIRSLDDHGIDYGTVADAIWSAGVVCDSVHSDPASELRTITDVFATTGGLTRTQAQDFVGAAVSAYCPQYNDYVTSWPTGSAHTERTPR